MQKRLHRQRRLRFEQLDSRLALSATIFEHGDIGYFVDSTESQLERYDISGETWLPPISVESPVGQPTVALADDDGLYVAYGKAVYRFDHQGQNRTHLFNAANDVNALHTDNEILFVNHSTSLYGNVVSIDKTNNSIIAETGQYISSLHGSEILPELNRMVGRSRGISPADLTYLDYTDGGDFTNGGDSPYHGSFADASQVWAFPDGHRIVDDSGSIYDGESLRYLGSFGTSIVDIDFWSDSVPVVLSGNQLTSYSSGILPTGFYVLADAASAIFVNDHNVIAFAASQESTNGFVETVIAIDSLSPEEPDATVDPNGLPYSPDYVAVSNANEVLLFSQNHGSLFFWDPVQEEYFNSVRLLGSPEYAAYSRDLNTVFLAYASGLIHKLDLSSETLEEEPFAILPSSPLGLSVAGEFVFAVDGSGAWNTHYSISKDGAFVSAVDWNYYSREYVWSDTNQLMYFFRDDTSPNDLLAEEINANGTAYPALPLGAIGQKFDSPLHASAGFQHPIHVAPDGSVVVLGSGRVFQASTLQPSSLSLANSFTDADWLGENLYTIREIAGVTQYQSWSNSTYEPLDVVQRQGTPLAILALHDARLLGMRNDHTGIPMFDLYDGSLEPAGMRSVWQNPVNSLDVNKDGATSPIDALIVVNELHSRYFHDEIGRFHDPDASAPLPYFDVNGDRFASAIDALMVINWLNSEATGEGEASANAGSMRYFVPVDPLDLERIRKQLAASELPRFSSIFG